MVPAVIANCDDLEGEYPKQLLYIKVEGIYNW